MAGKMKRVLASTVAAVALGTGAVAQAQETQTLPKEKIEHVQDNNTFIEKGARYFSKGIKKVVSGLTSMVTWPSEKIVNLATGTVRIAGNAVGDVGHAIGDAYIAPTIDSALGKASDFVDNTVADGVDIVHSSVNTVTDLTTDTIEGVASVASGKPEKGLRTIGGSLVQNTAKTLGLATEKVNNAVVNTLDLGTDVVADVVHNTVVRPIVHTGVDLAHLGAKTAADIALDQAPNQKEANQVKQEINNALNVLSVSTKSVPESAHLLAESMQDVVVDAAKMTGTVVRTGLNIAGNVGDAAVRGQLQDMAQTVEPHLYPFGEQVKKDIEETADHARSTFDQVAKTAEFAATTPERMTSLNRFLEYSSSEPLNKAAENIAALSGSGLMASATVNGVKQLTLLKTLDKLQKADAIAEIANETAKDNAGNAPTTQEVLSLLSGKSR